MDTSNAQAVSANLPLRYNYRPDSDLYVIYNVGTQFASIAPSNPPQVRENTIRDQMDILLAAIRKRMSYGKARRHFLRTISGLAALPAIGSVLTAEPRTGLSAASARDVRARFPLLGDSMNGHPLVYLDSAATTQRLRAVLDALDAFYLPENANPSMSLHALARHSAFLYDEARATVARTCRPLVGYESVSPNPEPCQRLQIALVSA
jgi:hypothetical protein